VNTVLL